MSAGELPDPFAHVPDLHAIYARAAALSDEMYQETREALDAISAARHGPKDGWADWGEKVRRAVVALRSLGLADQVREMAAEEHRGAGPSDFHRLGKVAVLQLFATAEELLPAALSRLEQAKQAADAIPEAARSVVVHQLRPLIEGTWKRRFADRFATTLREEGHALKKLRGFITADCSQQDGALPTGLSKAAEWLDIVIDSETRLQKAERDENAYRMPLKPSEMVEMGKRLEELEKPKAEERKGGRPSKVTGGKFPPVSEGKVRDKVGADLGVSDTTTNAGLPLEAPQRQGERYAIPRPDGSPLILLADQRRAWFVIEALWPGERGSSLSVKAVKEKMMKAGIGRRGRIEGEVGTTWARDLARLAGQVLNDAGWKWSIKVSEDKKRFQRE